MPPATDNALGSGKSQLGVAAEVSDWFESEITLCCRVLKTQVKLCGWVFGNDFRNWFLTTT
jgi:hypothetical protein